MKSTVERRVLRCGRAEDAENKVGRDAAKRIESAPAERGAAAIKVTWCTDPCESVRTVGKWTVYTYRLRVTEPRAVMRRNWAR